MNKKVISLILTVVLAINCFAVTAFASSSVDASADNAILLLNRMCDYLEAQTKDDRIALFNFVHSYMSTDAGVDYMIGLVDDGTDSDLVNGYIASFGITDSDREMLKFFLRFAKCIPTADRVEAYSRLDDRDEFVPNPAFSAEETAAMDTVYNAFIDTDLQNMLTTDHGLNKMVIFNFLIALGKNVTVTDAYSDANDFDIYAVNPNFASRIVNEFSDVKLINGKTWTTGADFMAILLDTINSSDTFTNEINAATKLLLGRDDVGIYTARKSDATTVSISTSDELIGTELQTVNFTASVSPNDVNTNLIVWYVNGVKQPVVGDSFSYTPNEYGAYEIVAAYVTSIGVEVRSDSATIYQLPAGSKPTTKPTEGTTGGSGYMPNTPSTTSKPGTGVIPAPEASSTSSYNDMNGHWANDYVETLSKMNILRGNDDGSFGPDFGVTREDVAVLLVRILGIENETATTDLTYTDSEAIADYAKNAVALLSERGIYKGYDDGSFMPKNVLTREEIMSLFGRIFGSDNASDIKFEDKGDISEWAYEYVQQMYAYGVVNGYPDNTIKPLNDVTRAEAAVMIYNLLYRLAKI